MKKVLLVFALISMSGCMILPNGPGSISERISGFDKTAEITMQPAWLLGGSEVIKLGLYKTSKMD